jgi:hypothetical protein
MMILRSRKRLGIRSSVFKQQQYLKCAMVTWSTREDAPKVTGNGDVGFSIYSISILTSTLKSDAVCRGSVESSQQNPTAASHTTCSDPRHPELFVRFDDVAVTKNLESRTTSR